jgi:hypothetical protein
VPRPPSSGQRKPTPRKDVAPGFTTEAAERTWRGEPPERGEAASSTIETLMLSLRTRGIAALVEENTLRRLSELSPQQTGEVVNRLQKLRASYPIISDGLIASILDIKK